MGTTHFISREKALEIEGNMPKYTAGVWRLCLETGLRVSDAINVKYADFDEKGRLHYTAKKTKKRGIAQVSAYFLQKYAIKSNFSGKYIFSSPVKPNKHVTRQTVFNHIKAACKKCRIDSTGISPHSARKYFAVETFNEKGLGATMNALQHGDVATTLMYALSDNALSELRKRLRALERKVDRFISVMEMCCDRLFGDDLLVPTDKGKEYKSD